MSAVSEHLCFAALTCEASCGRGPRQSRYSVEKQHCEQTGGVIRIVMWIVCHLGSLFTHFQSFQKLIVDEAPQSRSFEFLHSSDISRVFHFFNLRSLARSFCRCFFFGWNCHRATRTFAKENSLRARRGRYRRPMTEERLQTIGAVADSQFA